MDLQESVVAALPERDTSRDYFEIVSKVAYLIGVRKQIFENEHEPPQLEIYKKLDKDKRSRIIRNLCVMRTAIELNYKAIRNKRVYEHQMLSAINEFPSKAMDELEADGVRIYSAKFELIDYIKEINRNIVARINDCKAFFPEWLQWEYIRELFIMPDGTTDEGTKAAAELFYQNKRNYPYQVYINWQPYDCGNILFSDKKFVTILYEQHDAEFSDLSKVSNVSIETKGSIHDFIEASGKTVFVVDCENSDPYKLVTTFRNLDPITLGKVSKIILYDDKHASSAWELLEKYTDIPVEYMLIKRLKEHKSLVDVTLTAGTCREFYQNLVDSFVLVSSDSDFWALISAIPEAKFLVMLEREKSSYDLKKALQEAGIFFCYIDDFYSGDDSTLRTAALLKEAKNYMDGMLRLNIYAMMRQIQSNARVEMSESEQKAFMDKYIRHMHIVIDKDGNVSIELGKQR